MIDQIMFTFDKNFGRLNNLLELYSQISAGKGRKPTHNLDILRATTVLIHATLEDYLRNLMAWRLPNADKSIINSLSLVGTSTSGRRTKFELGELVIHKGKTVDEIILLSIKEHLNTISFNDTNDIAANLATISVAMTDQITRLFPLLNEMIKRRHNIVHRADRDDIPGSGHHKVRSISFQKVLEWKTTLDKFVQEVNKSFIVPA